MYFQGACPAPKELIGNPDELYFSPIRVNDITWNFEKFLINMSGAPYKRYEPEVHPDSLRVDIEEIIAPAKKDKIQKVKSVRNKVRKHSILKRKSKH